MKLNNDEKNAIIMAHNISTALNMLSLKVQNNVEVTKEDLQQIPMLAMYAGPVMNAVINGVSEPEPQPGPAQSGNPQQEQKSEQKSEPSEKNQRRRRAQAAQKAKEAEDVKEGEVQ